MKGTNDSVSTITNYGNLNILSSGTIESTNYRAIYNTGNVTVKNGTLKANKATIVSEGGSATIGDNSNAVSISTPTIISETYGIYGTSGTFNFYDGIIKAKTKAISFSGSTKTANNCVIVNGVEGDYKTAVLGPSEPIITAKYENENGETYHKRADPKLSKLGVSPVFVWLFIRNYFCPRAFSRILLPTRFPIFSASFQFQCQLSEPTA